MSISMSVSGKGAGEKEGKTNKEDEMRNPSQVGLRYHNAQASNLATNCSIKWRPVKSKMEGVGT